MKLSKQKIQSKQKENLQMHRASGHEWLYTEKNETKNKKRERTRLKRKKAAAPHKPISSRRQEL